jgi:hypothetical protein
VRKKRNGKRKEKKTKNGKRKNGKGNQLWTFSIFAIFLSRLIF